MYKKITVIGAASLFTIFVGALITKFVAVGFGPEGVALFSQVRNIGQLLIFSTTMNCSNTIIQLISKIRDELEIIYLRIVGLQFFIFGAVAYSLLCIYIDLILLNVGLDGYVDSTFLIFVYLGYVVSGAYFIYFTAIFKGRQKIKELAYTQILGGVFSIAVTVGLVVLNKLEYMHIIPLIAMISMLVVVRLRYPEIYFRGAIVLDCRYWKKMYRNHGRKVRVLLKKHLVFSVVTFLTSILGILSLIVVRRYFINIDGLKLAGNFDAAWTISTMGTSLLLTILSSTYLPEIARIKNVNNVNKALNQRFYKLYPLIYLSGSLAIFFSDFIIKTLYNSDFNQSSDILKIFIIAEMIKIIGIFIGYYFIAKGDYKTFLFFELVNLFSLLLAVYLSEGVFILFGLLLVLFYTLILLGTVFCARVRYGVNFNLKSCFIIIVSFFISFSFLYEQVNVELTGVLNHVESI